MKKLLVTFGCSWTYGVGVGYFEGMNFDDYELMAWKERICNSLSFRGLLSKKLDFENINFSDGGSSNQKQFRLAKEFFFSNKFKQLRTQYDKIIVLWGITSTARNELFFSKRNVFRNFSYHSEPTASWPFPKDFLMWSYDHDAAVYELAQEIKMFNVLFEYHGIQCIWFDTFNHHDYTYKIPDSLDSDTHLQNFLFFDKFNRDLLSQMLITCNLHTHDPRYHFSQLIIIKLQLE